MSKRTNNHRWTAQQTATLRQLYPDLPSAEIAAQLGIATKQVYYKAHKMGLKKSAEFYATRDAGRLNGVRGQQTRFKPGQSPWNKGKKFDAGGRSKETRFTKGQRSHTWLPIGTERVSAEGYLERKLTDTGCTRRDYVPVHRIVWRDAGRDIPPGHALVFKDGNKRNFDLDNLELVTRQELMRRNSYHNNYPKEVGEIIQLRGALNRKINNRLKKEKESDEQREHH